MAREYPEAPVAAVGGVVIDGGAVLLVRRAFPPRQGNGRCRAAASNSASR
jgi:ADP-ribose pyrophosphatase YjhB (NUDIX family)